MKANKSIATLGTAEALLFYAVGLWAFAGTRVTAQVFYSLQDTTIRCLIKNLFEMF
ncbi:MAG: hypothetical protein HZA12_03360 [Nitrospirae bacterium]|nr:hypothetical protein [Nitrospirota bacterium]